VGHAQPAEDGRRGVERGCPGLGELHPAGHGEQRHAELLLARAPAVQGPQRPAAVELAVAVADTDLPRLAARGRPRVAGPERVEEQDPRTELARDERRPPAPGACADDDDVGQAARRRGRLRPFTCAWHRHRRERRGAERQDAQVRRGERQKRPTFDRLAGQAERIVAPQEGRAGAAPSGHGATGHATLGTYALERGEAMGRRYPRLTHPLVREAGRLRRASWDEALERAAAGFRDGVARHGARSFGLFSCSKATNEVNYLAQKFARGVLGSNNIDSCNRT
jgi:hypothetical protein